MEKGLFHDLYKRLEELDVRSYPPGQLSGLLHGYLTVYSMVRVYPWLENDFGTPGDIHERAKSIVHLFPRQLRNEDVPVDTRAGYAADMMDVYQVYSDLGYLKNGLDAAYRILAARGMVRSHCLVVLRMFVVYCAIVTILSGTRSVENLPDDW